MPINKEPETNHERNKNESTRKQTNEQPIKNWQYLKGNTSEPIRVQEGSNEESIQNHQRINKESKKKRERGNRKSTGKQ